MRVLKAKELNEYRNELLKKQDYKCALCGLPLSEEDAVCDHDHSTGHCRGALHSMCNRVEGAVHSWLKGFKIAEVQWLVRLIQYWQADYSDNAIYPSHPNDMTKKFKRLSKTDMIELLNEIYPEMVLEQYTKSQLAKLYRDSWKSI
ncbi:endonuclease domain-containing protein [Vibrio diabolicus]